MTLKDFFTDHPRTALAFSGGVDSAYLLWAARDAGAQVRAYFVQSRFQPRFQLEYAHRLAGELGAELSVLELDVLAEAEIAANPPDRCYFCKRRIFSAILAAARADGFPLVIDGTNASDDAGDRPGMRALAELGVRSPLRECGLSKAEIRHRSQAAGLFTWDKPAYACLATRVPAGETITEEKLRVTETAENALFALGFTDFRVRLLGGFARVQVPADQMARLVVGSTEQLPEMNVEQREEIIRQLGPLYRGVLLDLEERHG